MMMQRPLAFLLGELAEGVILSDKDAPVTARSIEIAIPIDLRLQKRGNDSVLLGDAPMFRTRTAFDPDPANLSIRWEATALPDGAAS